MYAKYQGYKTAMVYPEPWNASPCSTHRLLGMGQNRLPGKNHPAPAMTDKGYRQFGYQKFDQPHEWCNKPKTMNHPQVQLLRQQAIPKFASLLAAYTGVNQKVVQTTINSPNGYLPHNNTIPIPMYITCKSPVSATHCPILFLVITYRILYQHSTVPMLRPKKTGGGLMMMITLHGKEQRQTDGHNIHN